MSTMNHCSTVHCYYTIKLYMSMLYCVDYNTTMYVELNEIVKDKRHMLRFARSARD